MGSFQNIKIARTSICNLILGKILIICFYFFTYNRKCYILVLFNYKMVCFPFFVGSPPSKVYGNMRAIAARSAERF